MNRISFAALAACTTFGAVGTALACPGFEVHDAYARASSAMAQAGAAFMVIHNHGDVDCHIVAVRSDVAERTELHTHSQDAQGVMRMVEVTEGFRLPAHGELIFERGGDHVMFLGLKRPLVDGETVTLTFVFADGAEYTVTVPVDNRRQPQHGGHGHGQGHGHRQRAGN